MPDISASLQAINELLPKISPSLGLALSEQFNVEITLNLLRVEGVPIQEMLAQTESVLSSVFSLSMPQGVDSVVIFSEADSFHLATLLAGEIEEPIDAITDVELKTLTPAMMGLGQGFASAMSVVTGDTVDLDASSTIMGSLSLPPVFALEEAAIQAAFSAALSETVTIEMLMLFTPEFAQSLISDDEDKSDNGMMDADELSAMLSELEGIGGGTAATAPMPGTAQPLGGSAPPFKNFPVAGPDQMMPRGLELILDIPLDVTVELGRVRMLIKDILELAAGSIVELERVAGEPVDLLVNGRLIAKGEVVVIEDNFGIRLTEIASPADRVAGLGKGR